MVYSGSGYSEWLGVLGRTVEMPIKLFSAHCRPSGILRAMRKHSGDLSEGDRPVLLATRKILGRTCRFYTSGEHTVDYDEGVTNDEMQDSVLLRFAHASIIAREPVGDKNVLWVDARRKRTEVWINGMQITDFLLRSQAAIRSGRIEPELVMDGNPIPKLKQETRNV